MLWISPTTKYASELESFISDPNADKVTSLVGLSKFLNFANQKSYFTTNCENIDNKKSASNRPNGIDTDLSATNSPTTSVAITIDWCERKHSAFNKIVGDTITGAVVNNQELESSEWDIPWIIGCIDDSDGGQTLSLNYDHSSKQALHVIDPICPKKITTETTISNINSELEAIKPERAKLKELIFPEIDRKLERILSNSMDQFSINILEYRKKPLNHKPKSQWKWAISVSPTEPIEKMIEKPILTFPFELDPFQKQAIYHLEQGHSVFIAAHTSAGKTLIAEYGAALALSKLTKAIYTSPIKALSNQKYREFNIRFGSGVLNDEIVLETDQDGDSAMTDLENKAKKLDISVPISNNITKIGSSFSDNDHFDARNISRNKDPLLKHSVGLLTGDMQVNPNSSLLVMTTEILRSMLYRNSPLLSDLSCVIFDEVHYMSDSERGVVWEETLILLPPTVQLILLSATLPNAMELADWLGRTRSQPIWVITTPHRPVPLEHYFLPVPQTSTPLPLVALPGTTPSFGITDNLSITSGNSSKATGNIPTANGKTTQEKAKNHQVKSSMPLTKAISSGKLPATKGQSLGSFVPSHIRSVLNFVQKSSLLPAIVFIFSRKRCEEALRYLVNMQTIPLLTKGETFYIHSFINKRVIPLIEKEKNLPQILSTLAVLRMGIATHHSGLLPILKESIEILFSKGLVKLLIATETFAMGVNMPAKCVVFGDIYKPDSGGAIGGRRILSSAEYTQMAGRSGRRGIDTKGLVFICGPIESCSNQQQLSIIKEMITGKGTPLQSQFRLTYSTILQLVRRGPSYTTLSDETSQITKLESSGVTDVDELMRKSFYENASQRSVPARAASLRQAEVELEEMKSSFSCHSYGCSDFEGMELIRKLVEEKVRVENRPLSLIGCRIVSLSSETEFLQPGIIVGYLPNSGGALGGNTGPGLVQALIFPISKEKKWNSLFERPINDKCSTYLCSIQTLAHNQFIVVPGVSSIITEKLTFCSKSTGGNVSGSSFCGDDITNDGPLDPQIGYGYQQQFDYCKYNSNQHNTLSLKEKKAIGGNVLIGLEDRLLLLKEAINAQQQVFELMKEVSSEPVFKQMACPYFSEHWNSYDCIRNRQQKVEELKWTLSTDSLALLPEYKNRLRVLELCNFIQPTSSGPVITLKGRIACEVCFTLSIYFLFEVYNCIKTYMHEHLFCLLFSLF